MEKLLLLVSMHMLGDYVLQNDFLAKFKSTNNFILFVHSWIWTFSICLGLKLTNSFSLFDFVFLLVFHFFIDKWKCNRKDKSFALTKDLYIDQFLHLLQIIIVMFTNF